MAKARAKKTTKAESAVEPKPAAPGPAAKKKVTKKTAVKTTVKTAVKTTGKTTAAKKTAAKKKTTTRASATAAKAAKKAAKKTKKAAAKTPARQLIRCYLCGERFEVSLKTMSTTCSACNKAIKVEDATIKSYLPVNDLTTCGQIKITKRGRVAAKTIKAGRGIVCEGSIEANIESDGVVHLGAKSSWKGRMLQSQCLLIDDGATLNGHVSVPWERE